MRKRTWRFVARRDTLPLPASTAGFVAGTLRLHTPPEFVNVEWKATGAYLREFYGRRYVSIGFTFDHGAVSSNWERPPFTPERLPVPSPPRDFTERPLGRVNMEQYVLNLRPAGPPEVRRWLHGPAKTRVIGSHYEPAKASGYHMTGGSLANGSTWSSTASGSRPRTRCSRRAGEPGDAAPGLAVGASRGVGHVRRPA